MGKQKIGKMQLTSVLLVSGLAAAWLAWQIQTMLQSMPPPYHQLTALPITDLQRQLLPGGRNGSALPPDLTGVFTPNDKLKAVGEYFHSVSGSHSVAYVEKTHEIILLDRFGWLWTMPTRAGRIFRTGYVGPGRPLGFRVADTAGQILLICNALQGLTQFNRTSGLLTVLSNRITYPRDDNFPKSLFGVANNVDVGPGEMIYFTSSARQPVALHADGYYDTAQAFVMNWLRGDSNGQLLRYNPETRITHSLVDNLAFPSGVSVSADGKWVAVVETTNARVLKRWIAGPKDGTVEILIDRLPGQPDSITRSNDGGFWLCLVKPLSALPHRLALYPRLRQLLSHFILGWVNRWDPQTKWGCVIKLDSEGQPVGMLMDQDGTTISSISAVHETSDGTLLMGSLDNHFIGVLKPDRDGEVLDAKRAPSFML